ncbi:MAG TPA: 3'-5' exonuclease [Candidatus Peribacteraceae bacterium]|nr:3'-5' exonuclease [Candidatus Peribacteraceae bacterium]
MLPPLTIFDVETTGLDPQRGHRIVEIAGVRIENGVMQDDSPFVTFVNPEREIPWDARQVNKITEEDVKTAPTIDLVLPQFLEFARGTTLVAHNAAFDMGFLHAEKQYCWGYTELPDCLCTMMLSRNLYSREFGHSLDAVTRRLGLTMPVMRHRALADVLLTAQALEKMMKDGNILSFGELKKRAGMKGVAKTN